MEKKKSKTKVIPKKDNERCSYERVEPGESECGPDILTLAMLELNQEIDKIMYFLQKYYRLGASEAEEIVLYQEHVNIPCMELETYLVRCEGYSRKNAAAYIEQLGVPRLLDENFEYCKLGPQELLTKAKQSLK